LELFVDPDARRGTARSLYQQMREAIVSGRVAEGERVPPSRDLARQLGVSRHTITTVYDQLVGEGYLDGRAGGGTFVNPVGPLGMSRREPSVSPTPVLRPIEKESLSPTFDLRPGAPDHGLFPLKSWRRSMMTALEQAPRGYDDPAGDLELRQAIAHWIARSRGLIVTADRIVVTSGAQHAIDLIIRLLVQRSDIVALEEPGYPPVRYLCEERGADIRPVPVDTHGIDVDQIPHGARLVYTTPAHQYPTGAVMSLPRRLALLDHAERHDVMIIEDDYDSEYRHVARPLEPLQRLDRNERVLYVGTFSKTLAPALRLGFAVLPRSIVEDCLALRVLSDWQPPAPQQIAMARFTADGHLGRHLKRTRKIYTNRHRLVTSFLQRTVELEHLQQFIPTCAGLHITTRLREGTDEALFVRLAADEGVALGALTPCWQAPDPAPGVIVGFGSIPDDQLSLALETLGHVLSRHSGNR
jgi:GntR family transcriptional regulator / MocR family aminotransferase